MKRIALVLCMIAFPALADVKNGTKTIDCYCTDTSGARVELGQSICLQVDGRMFMAKCEMSLNVPMWRDQKRGCESSSLPHSTPLANAG